MKGLIIGFWIDPFAVYSRPTNLPPSPQLLAKEIQLHGEMETTPNRLLYIENRRDGPKVTYSWPSHHYERDLRGVSSEELA